MTVLLCGFYIGTNSKAISISRPYTFNPLNKDYAESPKGCV